MQLVPDADRRYKHADYLTWPDDVRCELIGGRPIVFAQTPPLTHQIIVGEVYRQLLSQIKSQRRARLDSPKSWAPATPRTTSSPSDSSTSSGVSINWDDVPRPWANTTPESTEPDPT